MPDQETKQELIAAAKSLAPPVEGFSLRPRNFDEAFRFANLMAESDLLPKEFHGKPANVLVAVQLGMELGVSPMQALQNMYVINGKPAIYGDLLPAIVFQSGLLESIHEEGDEKEAKCTVKRRGHDPITRTFSMEDAKRAKAMEHGQMISLADKQTYKSYPKRMLQMRARAWAIRDMFPDVLKGVAIREEIEDSIETTATHIPEEAPIATPQPLKEKPDVETDAAKVVQPTDGVSKPAEREDAQGKGEGESAKEDAEGKPQEKPKIGKGKKNGEAKAATVVSDVHAGGPSGEASTGTQRPNGKPWEDESVPIEKRILAWVEHGPETEVKAPQNFLTQNFNQIPKERQIPILREYNKRRQGIWMREKAG